MCWALNFRALGITMIVPTLSVAIIITWQTRHMRSELYHNLAIDFWIVANCTWMVGEFFKIDENVLANGWGLRQFALAPFIIGLSIISYYYLSGLWKNKEEAVYVQSEEGGEASAIITSIHQEANGKAASK